jgi:hypothetical protein
MIISDQKPWLLLRGIVDSLATSPRPVERIVVQWSISGKKFLMHRERKTIRNVELYDVLSVFSLG